MYCHAAKKIAKKLTDAILFYTKTLIIIVNKNKK
jgi:hypothetical protein